MHSIITFLTDLKTNNNRDWFLEHKKQYEVAKNEFTAIISEVLIGMEEFEPGISELKPTSCLFRINRDVRFSANKSPYKTNFGASISLGGKKSTNSVYYIHLEPHECFIGGGIYMPMPDVLKKIRQEIDYNFDDFLKIIQNKNFKSVYPEIMQEGKLQRPPKEYDFSNPAIDYLKLKHFVFTHKIDAKDLKINDTFVKRCIDSFRELKPYNDFLNKSFE